MCDAFPIRLIFLANAIYRFASHLCLLMILTFFFVFFTFQHEILRLAEDVDDSCRTLLNT